MGMRNRLAIVAVILALPLWAQHVQVLSATLVTEHDAMSGELSNDCTRIASVEYQDHVRVVDLKTARKAPRVPEPGSSQVRFTPDDSAIYFVAIAPHPCALLRMSVASGAKQEVIKDVWWFDLSPDGRQVLFRRNDSSTRVLIADSDGKRQRTLLEPGPGQYSGATWDASGLVKVVEWDSQRHGTAWTLDPRTGERHEPTLLPARARFGVEMYSKTYEYPGPGRICRYSAQGKVVERLTPEGDRYIRVLRGTDDGTIVASRLRQPEFWDGLTDWLFQQAAPATFEIVT